MFEVVPAIDVVDIDDSVDTRADAHLQSDERIRREIRSWLESLDATVHTLNLDEAGPRK